VVADEEDKVSVLGALTVMVMPVEVAVLTDRQDDALDVITTVITSLLFIAELI
jgi:hypothetical protein